MAILTSNAGVSVGNKPSVLDLVVMQGATDTPLLNRISKGSVKATLHQWVSDRVRDAQDNANLEVSGVGSTPVGTKQKNINAVQILKNEVLVSLSQQAVDTYGKAELQHQLEKGAKEHALDIERAILGLNNATVLDNYTPRDATTAGKMAGIPNYVSTGNRTIKGSDTALTYNEFCDYLQPLWANGGSPDEGYTIYLGSALKKAINGFDSNLIVKPTADQKYNPLITEIYTDFGIVKVNMHRMFSTANGLDKAMLGGDFSEVAFKSLINTNIKDVPTADTATIKRFYTEGTLEVKNGDKLAWGDGFIA